MDLQQFNQSQEDLTKQNQQFWNDWYSKFQGAKPVAATPSSAPGFAGVASDVQNYAKTQGLGNVDANKLNMGVQNSTGLQSRSQDLESFLRDMETNRQRALQLGGQDFQRQQQIGNTEQGLAQLPINRMGQQLNTNNDIQRMWQAYHMGQTPSENLVGSAAGGLGGELASSLFGGGGKTTNGVDPYEELMKKSNPGDTRNYLMGSQI